MGRFIYSLSVWTVKSFLRVAIAGLPELHTVAYTHFRVFDAQRATGYYESGFVHCITPLAFVRLTLTGCYWNGAGFTASLRECSSAAKAARVASMLKPGLFSHGWALSYSTV
jgi:hypothetical protein